METSMVNIYIGFEPHVAERLRRKQGAVVACYVFDNEERACRCAKNTHACKLTRGRILLPVHTHPPTHTHTHTHTHTGAGRGPDGAGHVAEGGAACGGGGGGAAGEERRVADQARR
jgi:hypothetical protein